MKNCEYYILSNGLHLDSYTKLLEYIDSLNVNEWQDLPDLVFSISSKLDLVVKRLLEKSKDYLIERKARSNISAVIDGEPDLASPSAFGLNEFIESDLCQINGKRIVTKLDLEDYHDNQISKFVKKFNMSKEEAEAEFKKLMDHNDIISEDSIMLHSLLTNSLVVSDKPSASTEFADLFLKSQTSRFEGNSLLPDQLLNGLKESFGKTIFPGCRVVKNINLKSKLEGIDKDLIGHIDYLYVDLNGRLHLYNFKVSSLHYSQWPSAKVEKYKAQLVFLKYMLAENGFDVQNMDMNIIPVHVEYNEDFSKAKSIKVFDPRPYSSNLYRGGEYALEHYDLLISKFFKDNYVPDGISNDVILRATADIRKIFPSLNIHDDGIKKTAEEWIKEAPDCDPYDIEPLVIEDVHTPNHGYNLIIRKKDGTKETIVIKSDKSKNRNNELLEKVKEHVQYLSDNKGYLLNTIKDAIKEGYVKGTTNVFSDKKGLPSIFLSSVFSKYFSYHKLPTGEKVYNWELLEDLSDANILVFRNKLSQKNDQNQIDIISLSSFNLNMSPKLLKGDSVLGDYCYNVETNVFKGDFGNIELIRTMSLLNLMAPTLKNFKLGNVLVINTLSLTQRSYSASYLNRVLFSSVLSTVNNENSKNPIKNNLKNCKFVDEVDILLDEYNSIVDDMSDAEKDLYESLGFSTLEEVSQSQREHSLHNIINSLYNIMSNIYQSLDEFDEKIIIKTAESDANPRNRNLAKLLILASLAYLAVRGEQVIHLSVLSSIDSLTFTAMTVPDRNITIVADNLLITHDTISQEFMELFQPMLKIFEEFFDEIGYSRARGVTVGDEANQFNNLYDPDSELIKFKNPYDMSNDLLSSERKLLKEVLLAMFRITTKEQTNFTDPEDPKIAEYIKTHQEYLWVPLEKASKATMRQSFQGISAAMKYTKLLLTNSKERFENTINEMMSEEASVLDEGFSKLQLQNVFSLSMPIGRDFTTTEKSRRNLIKNKGRNFFETNLKNIFIDYLFRSISTELYNKLLIGSKALLLSLHLTSDYGGNEDAVNKEIEYIKDYLKVNVFLRSIVEPKSKKVLSFIQPVKTKVTNMLLMGNVVSFFRDCMQGVWENFTRSVIKFNTNISPKSVTEAYAYVTTHSTSDARAVNLLSKLCLRYRLSNTDVGKISERAKSSRNGIFNWDKMAYGTLRSPDFLNRMTLFVAKCIEDGCWDAWSIDKDGNLKYEWRNDKRFNLLANNDTSDKEAYAKLRSLYISKLREYQLEHPDIDLDLSLDTDLPTPYSNKEIVSIKAVSDNIYGSYDKSKKGMYENWALGIAFGTFTTWFNGIYNNYFAKAGLYSTNKLKLVLDTDIETGLPLFFDPSTETITTDPVNAEGTANDIIWKQIPIITLGIFPTIGSLYKVFDNGGINELKEYLLKNEGERANIRKLISDLLLFALFATLFKTMFTDGLLTDKYKDYKKEMKNNPLVKNLIVEILYKSSSRSYDSFLGPINVILLLGNNMNPPYYSVPLKLFKDSYGFIFGEKEFNALMFDNFGFTRSYRDSYRAEKKKEL